jgi:hypothetical protein
MSTLAEKSKLLIETLSSNPVNILTVRSLCRENPGLIASAGLRLKTWSVLLLGSSECTDIIEFPETMPECAEQHVLEADVPRTRAEIPLLKTPEVRQSIQLILQKFCVDHNIQYKQGMNEVTLHIKL